MTPEEQEALSLRYRRGVWCVPLSTGRYAIFSHPNNGALLKITAPELLFDAVYDLANREPEPQLEMFESPGLDLDVDLEL